MINRNYNIGDIVRCYKGLGIKHVGIIAGPNSIFHNSPERGEHLSSLADFTKGREIEVQRVSCDPWLVLERIRKRLSNPKKYSALIDNCEHSVTAVLEAKESSPQLQGFALLAASIGVLAYFANR